MDQVVYLLGAGFSSPLGLPVTSNFLTKSKEMCAEDRQRYSYFGEVFRTIKELSIIKNYFDANLFNIEEILSILEMEDHLEGKRLNETFTRYIADVITYYTPPIQPHQDGQMPGNWEDWLFGVDTLWNQYGRFFATVLNLQFQRLDRFRGNYIDIMVGTNKNKPQARYSIVTLNYDLIPEMVCGFINSYYSTSFPCSFLSTVSIEDEHLNYSGYYAPPLAKLHGSVDTVIVPPTWNKGSSSDVVPAWKLAYELLTKANHIRIIGYSLPTADTYVKYLLKSAIISNEHVKQIDVICLDPDGSVQKRYDDFIKFDYYKFQSGNVSEYLRRIALNQIEDAHFNFMK